MPLPFTFLLFCAALLPASAALSRAFQTTRTIRPSRLHSSIYTCGAFILNALRTYGYSYAVQALMYRQSDIRKSPAYYKCCVYEYEYVPWGTGYVQGVPDGLMYVYSLCVHVVGVSFKNHNNSNVSYGSYLRDARTRFSPSMLLLLPALLLSIASGYRVPTPLHYRCNAHVS